MTDFTTTRRAFYHPLRQELKGVDKNMFGLARINQSVEDTIDGERVIHALTQVLDDLPYGLTEPDLKAAVTRFLHRNLLADDADEFVRTVHDTLDVYDEVLQADIRSGSCRQIVVGGEVRIVDSFIHDKHCLTIEAGDSENGR